MPYERKTSDILISDELKSILSEIESQSLVAQLLLKKRHAKEDLAEGHVNWISVSTQDKSKISYITQERAEQMDEAEVWTSSKRFHAKPGGFIGKIFKNIPGKEVELFSTLFRNMACRPSFSFKVVKGESIRSLYHYDAYESDCGSLGASCMRYDNCQGLMDIYVENSDIISMLAMKNEDGGLIGRALLWDFDGYKIMDRIYTTNDEKYAFYFKEWATKNNYLFKSAQNWFDTMNFERIGDKKQKLKLEIKLGSSEYRRYPYMDTFKFYSPDKGTFSNFQPEGRFQTVCSPDGSTYGSDYLVLDIVDDVFRYRHDAVYVSYLNGYTSCGNTVYSEVNDEHILSKDSVYDEVICDYVFREDELNCDRVAERRAHIKKREEEREQRRRARASAEQAAEAPEASPSIGFDLESTNLEDLLAGYYSILSPSGSQEEAGEMNTLLNSLIGRISTRRSRRRSQEEADSVPEPMPEPEQ